MDSSNDLYAHMTSQLAYSGNARDEMEHVLGNEEVLGHLIQKGVRRAETGAVDWQEVAVITPTRLLLWVSRDTEEPGDDSEARKIGVLYETDFRVMPLRSIQEVELRTAYGAGGGVVGVSVLVKLAAIDGVDQGRFRYDNVHFAQNVASADPGSMGGIVTFGRILAGKVNAGRIEVLSEPATGRHHADGEMEGNFGD